MALAVVGTIRYKCDSVWKMVSVVVFPWVASVFSICFCWIVAQNDHRTNKKCDRTSGSPCLGMGNICMINSVYVVAYAFRVVMMVLFSFLLPFFFLHSSFILLFILLCWYCVKHALYWWFVFVICRHLSILWHNLKLWQRIGEGEQVVGSNLPFDVVIAV